MPFLRKVTVNSKTYVQIAEYYCDSTKVRKVKILKSFGVLTDHSLAEAEICIALIQAVIKIRESQPQMEWEGFFARLSAIGKGFFAAYLGFDCVQWIFDHGKALRSRFPSRSTNRPRPWANSTQVLMQALEEKSVESAQKSQEIEALKQALAKEPNNTVSDEKYGDRK